MNDMDDVHALAELWRSSEVVPSDLRRKVVRQRTRLAWLAAADVAAAVIFLVGSLAMAMRHPTADRVTLTVAIWAFTFAATAFSFWNRRGLWQPSAETTDAFLAIASERAHAARRAITFGIWLWSAEMVFVFGWQFHRTGVVNPAADTATVLSTTAAIILLGALLVVHRRNAEERRRLDATRRQLNIP